MEESKLNFNSFFKNIKRTYKYSKKGKKFLIIFALCNIVLCAISVIVPVLSAKRLVYLTSSIWKQLLIVAIAIFAMEIMRNIFRYFSRITYNKFYYDVRENIQLDLIRETLKITQEDLNKNASGVFIERIVSDTDNIADVFNNLIDILLNLLSSLGVLISTLFIDYRIFLSYTIFLIISYIYNKKTSEINYKNRKKFKKNREKNVGFISEIVRGSKDIKILDAEESFVKTAKKNIEETNSVSYYYNIKKALYRFFGGDIQDVFDILMTLLLIYMLYRGNITLSIVLIIYNYHYQIIWIAEYLESLFDQIKTFDLAADRIFGILENTEFHKEEFGTKKLKQFKGNIKFDDVWFSYEKGNYVLKGINLDIKQNEIVAFVGSSGVGKSTIFNLISQINKPDKGIVSFDGTNINELDKHSIRGNLSIISQNPYIYNMSIKDNLQIIKSSATLKEIEEACKLACLSDFIESLPNKYDTLVGEGGVTLSGGQKQRLAIARALLLKTKVILFDEATSALDNVTQAEIQQSINNMKGEYTILIIAHRITTIMNADRIFVVDNGKICDVGTHEYLLKNSKVYKKLYSEELINK